MVGEEGRIAVLLATEVTSPSCNGHDQSVVSLKSVELANARKTVWQRHVDIRSFAGETNAFAWLIDLKADNST